MNLPAALNLVEPLDRQTLGERAYAQLADLLISGRLAPGEKLSLRSAADVLGVSIMPVRGVRWPILMTSAVCARTIDGDEIPDTSAIPPAVVSRRRRVN